MAAITKEQWLDARLDWEAGLSLDKVAQKYGVSVTTVRSHKDKEGWARLPEVPVVPVVPTVPAEALEPIVAESDAIASLEAEVVRLRAEAAEAKAAADALRTDIKLSLPTTKQGVIDYFGRPYMEKIALTRYNRERRSQGFNPVELLSGDPVLEAEVQRTAEQFLNRQTSWAGESNLRTLKMARPDPNNPTGYRVVGIPVEPTINQPQSGAEGQAQAIRRYTSKGWKLITPQLCQRGPCHAVAATEDGKLKYQGYCSAEHMAGDPFINQKAMAGMTTTANATKSGLDLTSAVR